MNYLIISAGSGIGMELKNSLLQKGHKVWATYNNSLIPAEEGLITQKLNVVDDEVNIELPEILDGFVYCPGAINLAPFHRIKAEDFELDYKLQVIGAVKTLQHALPNLKKGNGSVVLFSTVAVGNGFNYHSCVSASKGAIEGLTRSLSAEFAPKIRVNCIAPSLTDTPLSEKFINSDSKKEANAKRHPMQRIGTVKDIVNGVEFLLNNENSWITGQVLKIDGGISTIKS
jgi:NAD(P)-dependent dehydrogenase (short-subunit alcohol dehydrogenase family)